VIGHHEKERTKSVTLANWRQKEERKSIWLFMPTKTNKRAIRHYKGPDNGFGNGRGLASQDEQAV
jgi:hypothetical protein